jgi:pimeloyl-ACP methyl ester carboxylesterase
MTLRSLLRRQAAAFLGVAAAATFAIVATLNPASALAAPAGAANCRDVTVPVTLEDGSTGPIVGSFCVPAGATTVQVLVHGISYDQYYFDSPYKPELYSVARAANKRGQASLVVSRLGVGKSYQPADTQVTLRNNAAAIHQVVQALRSGLLGQAFNKVVLVGHSLGSLTSWLVAGHYGGVDAVVATGASHQPNLVNAGLMIGPTLIPAVLDPKFAHSGLDLGYITTRAGGRAIFYNEANTDPALIDQDEKLKQTVTLGEYVTGLLDTESQNINVPVLSVNGTDDPFFCNGPLSADCSSSERFIAGERRFYRPGASLDAIMVPNGGHDVTLSRAAPETIAQIEDWITKQVS